MYFTIRLVGYIFFTCIYQLFCFSSYAQVSRVQSFVEIDQYMKIYIQKNPKFKKQNFWKIFDIDNTLITPDTENDKSAYFATDAYFYNQKKLYFHQWSKNKSLKDAKKLAYLQAVKEWNQAILKNPLMNFVEPASQKWIGFPLWIKKSQEEGFVVMGHTAREVELEKITIQQLKEKEIQLDRNLIALKKIQFSPSFPFHPEPALFDRNIFYVGRGGIQTKNHKGKRLVQLLKELKSKFNILYPTDVLFVDDREEHVHGVDVELSKIGIQVHGFVYLMIHPKE